MTRTSPRHHAPSETKRRVPMGGVHTNPGKKLTITAVAFQFFINGLVLAAWATSIPHVKNAYSFNDAELGVVLLIMAAGALLFMSLAGYFSHVFGSRRMSIQSALLFPSALVLIFAAPNCMTFLCSIVLFGAANGAMDVLMNHQAKALEENGFPRIMAFLHGCSSTGILAGIMTFGVIGDGHYVARSVTLLTGILIVARWLFPHLLDDVRSGEHRLAIGELRNCKLLMFGILSFLTMVTDGAIAEWSKLYLIRVEQVTDQVGSLGYVAFTLLMIAGRISGDRVKDAIGCRALIAISGSLASAGMTTALFMPSFAGKLAGFALLGLGMANLVPIIFSEAASMNTVSKTVGLTFVSVCGYSGFLVGPPIIGRIAEAVGLGRALLFIIAVGVIVACASVFFDRHRSGQPEP
ncbi:MFS transporter [Sinorhizobium meliloti]|nr:MFS transporter [Sinorhizobium meliloti]KKA13141.1 membrane protein [Sinorhizobium meliloti]MDW9378470.1 MFS transporter [Sinorhizobium meliloti]MDW9451877.1 MFS transporter [Sinorhizobium meliloti]MDW9496508.1 MFS transporter [Sinorhizobium meliloti]